MKPLDMYSNSSQLHLISGIFGVSRIFYYFFWNCWTSHLHKVFLKHIYCGFFKIETFTYCFTTLECNRFPIQVFSHMNFMKTSFSCCIKLLIWTWLEFFNLIQNGQNSFDQFVLIMQLHIIIMLARLLQSNMGKQISSQLMHYVIATSSQPSSPPL